jgi:hypothetical protein
MSSLPLFIVTGPAAARFDFRHRAMPARKGPREPVRYAEPVRIAGTACGF